MRIRRNKNIQDDESLPMTPMIDIVFQLLIFFLLSAKFIALEGQLASYLPKDKGLSTNPEPLVLTQVSFDLIWEDVGGGRVVCRTMDYREPGTDERKNVHVFHDWEADASGYYRYGSSRDLVKFEYTVPNFDEIEEYLKYRKKTYIDPKGTGIPVTVQFDGKVSVQVVTTLLDICTRLRITDFTLTAKELD